MMRNYFFSVDLASVEVEVEVVDFLSQDFPFFEQHDFLEAQDFFVVVLVVVVFFFSSSWANDVVDTPPKNATNANVNNAFFMIFYFNLKQVSDS